MGMQMASSFGDISGRFVLETPDGAVGTGVFD